MIRNIRHKGVRALYEEGSSRGVQAAYAKKMLRILNSLNTARSIMDMDQPGYRLHPLTGDLKGFWSVTVSANWRIIFRFDGMDVCDVNLIDYH